VQSADHHRGPRETAAFVSVRAPRLAIRPDVRRLVLYTTSSDTRT
jgi:hypothetical protein